MAAGSQFSFRRQYMQIGLRSFLLLCLIVGFGVAFGSRYGHSVHSTVRSVSHLEKNGYRVHSDFIDRFGLYAADRRSILKSVFEWGLAQPVEVMALNPSSYGVQDSLRIIAGLQGVQVLRLNHVELDGHDLQLLTPMRELVQLELQGTRVQDRDLGALLPIPTLRQLDLSETQITDQGLATVARMKSLRLLNIYNTSVSPSALAYLRSLRPDLTVNAVLIDGALQLPRVSADVAG